jgi:drug/metabolite transporter (DMT)-like permease
MSIITTSNPSQQQPKVFPYIALSTGIIALSLTAMFVRWADAPPTITGFFRLFLSSLILMPIFFFRNRNNNRVSRQNIIFPILGGFFTAFDFAFWNSSVLYTTASNATLLGNTAPIWVALVTIYIFHNKLPKGFWAGLVLALGGSALVLGYDFLVHPRLGVGDMMAITAGFFYAGYLLSTQKGRESLDPLSYMTIMVISATVFTFFINLVLGFQFSGYSQQTWLVFILLALVSQILGYMSVSYALGHLPASVVAPTMIGQPILTTLLAIPLLGELPHPFQFVGGMIVLAGIYLVHNSYNKSIADGRN